MKVQVNQFKIYKQVQLREDTQGFKPFYSENERRHVAMTAFQQAIDGEGFPKTVQVGDQLSTVWIGENHKPGQQYTRYYFVPYSQGNQTFYSCVEVGFVKSKAQLTAQELAAADSVAVQKAVEVGKLSPTERAALDYVIDPIQNTKRLIETLMASTSSLYAANSAHGRQRPTRGILGWFLERQDLLNYMPLGFLAGALLGGFSNAALVQQGFVIGYNEVAANLMLANFIAVLLLAFMMGRQYLKENGGLTQVKEQFEHNCPLHNSDSISDNLGFQRLIKSKEVAIVTSTILISTAAAIVSAIVEPLSQDLALGVLGCTLLANIIFAPMLAKQVQSCFSSLSEEQSPVMVQTWVMAQ